MLANALTDFIFRKQVLGAIIVFIATILIIIGVKKLIPQIINRGRSEFEVKRRKTVVKLFQSIFKWLLAMIGILIVLDFYGVNTRSLITSLGVVGVVLGLALQDTVKDFISGISLILENYLQVGDIVTYNDFTGEVIELGLRVTKIKNADGRVLIIANRNIDSIINLSQKKANIYLNIDTAYEEKQDKVEKVLTKVIETAIEEKVILPDSKYLGVNELDSSSVKYLVQIVCDQTKRYPTRREMLKRIKLAYEKNHIKIPYNQIEVHHGSDI